MRIPKLILALDNFDKKTAFNFLDSLEAMPTLKIGMEMYYRYGREFLSEISSKYKTDIFLDLKLHDIPNTVGKSIQSLEGLPINFLTVHLTGGEQMLQEAKRSQEKYLPHAKLLGVTYLTSLGDSDFKEIWNFDKSGVQKSFKNLVSLALRVNIPGLVLSAEELSLVDEVIKNYPKDDYSKFVAPLKVCPGIRFSSGQGDDQKRVCTPQLALEKGADYLVMGRAITQSSEPNEKILKVKKLFL